MKNIREYYKIETLDEFITNNYSDLFENMKKPVLGRDILQIKQRNPKSNALKNNINKKNINVNNKAIGKGIKAVVTNTNITTPKMKLSTNNNKSSLGKSISFKNESYYYTEEDAIKYQEKLNERWDLTFDNSMIRGSFDKLIPTADDIVGIGVVNVGRKLYTKHLINKYKKGTLDKTDRKYVEDNFKKWAISEVNNKGLRRLPKTQKEYDEAMIMFFKWMAINRIHNR